MCIRDRHSASGNRRDNSAARGSLLSEFQLATKNNTICHKGKHLLCFLCSVSIGCHLSGRGTIRYEEMAIHFLPSFRFLKRNTSVLKTLVLATECSLSTRSISPSGYFVKRIFGQLGIFVTSDNFDGLLLSKTVNICSHMRENEMLKETSSPAWAFFSPEGAC